MNMEDAAGFNQAVLRPFSANARQLLHRKDRCQCRNRAQAPEALSKLGPEENTDKHIVDVLIEERAAGTDCPAAAVERLLRPSILPILGYKQTIEDRRPLRPNLSAA